jgi:uncharacterized protein YndB with AHSA1/START domain
MKQESLVATVSADIQAPVEKVWDALTNPALIKKYLFGTETVTDWKVGSPVIFQGSWEGKEYRDKGTVLANEKNKLLKYTYWSSMAGTPDLPENYANVTYTLVPDRNRTVLTIEQDNCKTPESRDHSAKNWGMILEGIQKLLG